MKLAVGMEVYHKTLKAPMLSKFCTDFDGTEIRHPELLVIAHIDEKSIKARVLSDQQVIEVKKEDISPTAIENQMIRIIGNRNGHCFSNGDELKVVETRYATVFGIRGDEGNYIEHEDYEIIG